MGILSVFNRTHYVHVVAAVLMQLLLSPLVGLATGGLIAVTFFMAREYSQVEFRVYRDTGKPISEMMPWHVLKPYYWKSVDRFLDWALPAVACYLVVLID